MVIVDASASARGGGGRGGGGGGGGRGGGGSMASSSVSGANRAAPSPSNPSAGNRPSTGDIGRGNNINTGDINIDRGNINVDVDGGYGNGWGYGGGYHHPIAAGVVIGAVAVSTAAVMGSYYYALPPTGCSPYYTNSINYYQCGSVYYQQTWAGNDVVYVVVNP